jgi:hypothetical protein
VKRENGKKRTAWMLDPKPPTAVDAFHAFTLVHNNVICFPIAANSELP